MEGEGGKKRPTLLPHISAQPDHQRHRQQQQKQVRQQVRAADEALRGRVRAQAHGLKRIDHGRQRAAFDSGRLNSTTRAQKIDRETKKTVISPLEENKRQVKMESSSQE
jgi:type II secretory pathway pseudopilin PulG